MEDKARGACFVVGSFGGAEAVRERPGFGNAVLSGILWPPGFRVAENPWVFCFAETLKKPLPSHDGPCLRPGGAFPDPVDFGLAVLSGTVPFSPPALPVGGAGTFFSGRDCHRRAGPALPGPKTPFPPEPIWEFPRKGGPEGARTFFGKILQKGRITGFENEV